MIRVLFLAATPTDKVWLRVDEESRAIDEALRKSAFRDEFQIEKHFAVRIGDLMELLLRYQPQIVHFSGHGSENNEILLEDDAGYSHPVPVEALSRLFSVLKDNLRCIILNACYSEWQAQAIAEHIDCVIGMSEAMSDLASIKFAAAFYLALGYGRDVQTAFELGCVAIDLESLVKQDIPRLLAAKSAPTEITFALGDKASSPDLLEATCVHVSDVQGNISDSVITGRDVIRSIIVTGDHNQVFVGNYERLQDAYIKPWEVFDRTSRLPFTGREWLVAEVDAFLQKYDRGYFILEANAGLGKTAFLAWIVQQRNYIHHFCELSPGVEGVSHGLKNLATQLALAYKLKPEGIFPDAASRPDYLYDLLKEATAQRHKYEKIVVVVDALDEAGTLGNQNVLGLPTGLPEGVYFIVSQRPASATLYVKDPTTTVRRYVRFSAESAENQADMRRFLDYAATLPEIIRALQVGEHKYSPEQFTTTLLTKCRGVWIYLYFVVQEIRLGDRSPLDLAALPDGMTAYYVDYWRRWRDGDKKAWDDLYVPVLTMLAAAQEPLSCERLIAWSGVKITEQNLRRLLEEHWLPFLAISEQSQQTHYRFYHATLYEFFEGQINQNDLTPQPLIVKELTEATRSAHSQLAERYLKLWGGFEGGLLGLQVQEKRDYENRYGLRYLATHLAAAKRIDELHRLLRTEWVQCEEIPYIRQGWRGWLDKVLSYKPTSQRARYQNVWHKVREEVGQTDGYLADVIRAWRLVENYGFDEVEIELAEQKKQSKGKQSEYIGLQCRYALIFATLNSFAHNIKPKLLVELIKKEIWLPNQGLVYARQVPDSRQQIGMLLVLTTILPAKEKLEVLQEALAVARSIEHSYYRAPTMAGIARYLVEQGDPTQALAVARSIEHSSSRATALAIIALHLSTGEQQTVLQEALAVARSIEDSSSRATALVGIAPHLSAGEQQTVLQEALAVARSIEHSYYRATALVDIAPHLSAQQLQEALAVARSIEDSNDRTTALTGIAPHLVELSPTNLYKLWRETLAVLSLRTRADLLSDLAALSKVISCLGGTSAVVEVAQAIQDVSRWWP